MHPNLDVSRQRLFYAPNEGFLCYKFGCTRWYALGVYYFLGDPMHQLPQFEDVVYPTSN